jgi:hypothetical protein
MHRPPPRPDTPYKPLSRPVRLAVAVARLLAYLLLCGALVAASAALAGWLVWSFILWLLEQSR